METKTIQSALDDVLGVAMEMQAAVNALHEKEAELQDKLNGKLYDVRRALYRASEKYDYREALRSDIKDYIDEHDVKVNEDNRDEVYSDLLDTLFIEDGVTGNASGSYTFSTWQAEEYLCHNLDLLGEALEEFGSGPAYIIEKGAEACDVTIRCYLLSSVLNDVLDEIVEGSDGGSQ